MHMSPSATSATELGREKGQLTAVIYGTNLPFACRSERFEYRFVFYMPTGKMVDLMRGPFPVSVESHPLNFSVYSKFKLFIHTESIGGVQQQERKLDSLSFSAIPSHLLHLNRCHL